MWLDTDENFHRHGVRGEKDREERVCVRERERECEREISIDKEKEERKKY